MAWFWRVSLLAAALAHAVLAEEVELSCLAGEQCEQEEVGMLQSRAIESFSQPGLFGPHRPAPESTHRRSRVDRHDSDLPVKLISQPTAGCGDDDAGAIEFAASHNVTVSGCADAGPYCNHPDVASEVWAICCEACVADAAKVCDDYDFGAVVFAALHNVTVRGCQDASPYCEHPDVGEQVRAICCTTCSGSAAPTSYQQVASISHAKTKRRIKIRRATVRKAVDIDAVWDQVKGSVEIGQLTEMVKDAATKKLQDTLNAKLDELKEAFPDADEIKEKFSAQWDEITKGVNIEELQSMVDAAKEQGGAKLTELQGQLEQAMKNFNMGDVKKQAQEKWDEMQLSLPDLDDLTENMNNLKDQATVAWDQVTSSDQWGQAADAATSAANSAKDAALGVVDTVGSYFPGWWW